MCVMLQSCCEKSFLCSISYKTSNKEIILEYLFLRYSRIFVTFTITHIQVVEAMHDRLFLRIFKISGVRHLEGSRVSGCRDLKKSLLY